MSALLKARVVILLLAFGDLHLFALFFLFSQLIVFNVRQKGQCLDLQLETAEVLLSL